MASPFGPTRRRIFAEAAAQLRRDFESLVVVPHRGEKGAEAEGLLRRFLAERLPRRFGVGAGFILDDADSVSKQTDVLIYDALNCPVYRASERASIYPADNVAAAIEVKSRLDRRELEDAFEKVACIKALRKVRGTGPLHAQTFSCVFAFDSLEPRTLLRHYCELVRQFGLGRHPDLVVVLDRCAIELVSRHPTMAEWNAVLCLEGFGGSAGEGAHFGASLLRLGETSLDFFFRMLLMGLNTFRPFSEFKWSDAVDSKGMEVEYLMSHTEEKDPERRKRILKRYAREAKAIMNVLPPRDDVIHLGPGSPAGPSS